MDPSDVMNEEIAVIIEQYADHAETRLPGMGPAWQTIGPTSDAAINRLMARVHHHPDPTSTAAAPVAVSLLAVPRHASDLRPPTVVHAPDGLRILFSGDLNPIEPPPPEALWLKPDAHIPDDAPDGSVFVLPHRTPPFRADHVVIRTNQVGHRFRFLNHPGGGVVLVSPAPTVLRIGQRPETPVTPSPELTIPVRNPQPDDLMTASR